MAGTLLVLNAGSSSVKFRLFGIEESLPLLAVGNVAGLGEDAVLTVREEGGENSARSLSANCLHEHAFEIILDWIEGRAGRWTIEAAGHRVVHGGTMYQGPVVVDEKIMADLRELVPLAPLHQPHNLAGIKILGALKPGVRQVACFDTAFHAGHERLFSVFALPDGFEEKGIRRYGFHGLSYEWIAHVLKRDYPDIAQGRVIAAHLGNGASLCALREGESVDTTMGMSALDGLPMGTRCGALDPGAVIYMIRDLGFSADEAEALFYNECGLKGLSGISHDVRVLLEREGTDEQARFALSYFVLKTAQQIAAMAISAGGADALVFTGGIGENAAAVRNAILERLSGIMKPRVMVIPANEERMVAMHVVREL